MNNPVFKERCIALSVYSIFQARESCLGDEGLKDGICPEFICINHESCSCKGKCTADNKACVCNEGFSGFDCSIDLEGEKLCVDMKLYSWRLRS